MVPSDGDRKEVTSGLNLRQQQVTTSWYHVDLWQEGAGSRKDATWVVLPHATTVVYQHMGHGLRVRQEKGVGQQSKEMKQSAVNIGSKFYLSTYQII